jgi:hypothetical protein
MLREMASDPNCVSCAELRRLNQRYRDTIERLIRERDELRALERVLGEMVHDNVAEDDAGRSQQT